MTMSRLLVVFFGLFAICALVDGVQVSIDCGSSDSYTDENTISWVGDDEFVKTGEPMVVENTMSSTVPRSMSTLRLFRSRNKNCYSIPTDIGEKVLVRAYFFYGDYDLKNNPPTFALLLDGIFWYEVVTSNDYTTFYEAIYVTQSDTISVCVAQESPGMLPFISALEVRSLNMKIYDSFESSYEVRSLNTKIYDSLESSYALITRMRVAFGAKHIIRYPEDTYDRIWLPVPNPKGLFTEATTTATSINTSLRYDDVPEAVMRNAFISPDISVPINLVTNLPSEAGLVLMNFYFTEVFQLTSTQNRSFTVNLNTVSSRVFTPEFGSVLELTLSNQSVSGDISFSIVAAPGATLPPLINAFEVYSLTELSDGTNLDDVKGLNVLKEAFDVLKDWTGDPCLPAPHVWDWLNCTDDRVTSLYLSSLNLSGELPDFSSMNALETIDFHNNSLKGAIPDFLGTLPNLTRLNLSNNNFDGLVPTSLSKSSILKDLTGNPNLIDSTNTTTETDNKPPKSSPSGSGSAERKIDLLLILVMFTFPVFFFLQ